MCTTCVCLWTHISQKLSVFPRKSGHAFCDSGATHLVTAPPSRFFWDAHPTKRVSKLTACRGQSLELLFFTQRILASPALASYITSSQPCLKRVSLCVSNFHHFDVMQNISISQSCRYQTGNFGESICTARPSISVKMSLPQSSVVASIRLSHKIWFIICKTSISRVVAAYYDQQWSATLGMSTLCG